MDTAKNSDLASRFQRLNLSSSISIAKQPAVLSTGYEPIYDSDDGDDGKTVEELLADLGPEEEWTIHPDDPKEIQRLLDEANKALPVESSTTQSHIKHNTGVEKIEPPRIKEPKNAQLSPAEEAHILTSEEQGQSESRLTEDQEADIYLQQILDELSFSPQDPSSADDLAARDDANPAHPPPSLGASPLSNPHFPSTPTSLKNFPTAPTAIRSPSPDPQTFLSLPSAPTSPPTHRQVGKAPPPKPKISDEEIESWCIICNEDATVRCLGCEGDLYCRGCWQEGHGKEAGLEERGHRWVRYKRG